MTDNQDEPDIITVGELRDKLSDFPHYALIVLKSPVEDNEFFAINRTIQQYTILPSQYTEQDTPENTRRKVIALNLTDAGIIRDQQDQSDMADNPA